MVRDGSADTRKGLDWVGAPSGWSGTGQGTFGKVQARSRDSQGSHGRNGAQLGKSETSLGTLGEVWDG